MGKNSNFQEPVGACLECHCSGFKHVCIARTCVRRCWNPAVPREPVDDGDLPATCQEDSFVRRNMLDPSYSDL